MLQGAKPLRPALKSGSATTPAQVPQPPGPHRRVVLRFPKVLHKLACRSTAVVKYWHGVGNTSQQGCNETWAGQSRV